MLKAAQISGNRGKAEAVACRNVVLLAVQSHQAQNHDNAVDDAALPGGEHIDAAEGEATKPASTGTTLIGYGGQNRGKSAGGQSQTLFQLRQHRCEIGTLRQAIRPTTLKRFDHRGGDPGFTGQFAHAQPFRFTPGLQGGANLPQRFATLLFQVDGLGRRLQATPSEECAQSHQPTPWLPVTRGPHSSAFRRRQRPSARDPRRRWAMATR